MFIERFFHQLQQHEAFEGQEARQELVMRITKILHCQNPEELEIDGAKIEDMMICEFTNRPLFIAAECFRDTLIEIGVNEDSAETARRAFLTLKKNHMEET